MSNDIRKIIAVDITPGPVSAADGKRMWRAKARVSAEGVSVEHERVSSKIEGLAHLAIGEAVDLWCKAMESPGSSSTEQRRRFAGRGPVGFKEPA